MSLRACFVPLPSSWAIAALAASGSRDSQPGSPNRPAARVPSRRTTTRAGSPRSRHHTTSVTSPNVQICAAPVPFSGSASSWATIGTGTRNTGVSAVVPTSGAYRSSAGFTTSATQAGMSSGREVSISRRPPPPSMSKAMRW